MTRPAAPGLVSTTVTAQNQFTPWLKLEQLERAAISIIGLSLSGTVTLQRRLNGVDVGDVKTWTASAEESVEAETGSEYRLGIKTGDYTSGSAALMLKKGT